MPTEVAIDFVEHQEKFPNKMVGGIIIFILGVDDNQPFLAFAVVLILVLRVIFQNRGILNNSLMSVESTSSAAQRLLVNQRVLSMHDHKLQNLCKKCDILEEKLQQ